MAPGATTFTRIPSGPPMTASERASPSRPALAAEYAGDRVDPSWAPTMLPTITTDPRAARSAGQASRAASYGAVRSTASVSRQWSGASQGPLGGSPAAHTSASRCPSGAAAASAAVMVAGSVASPAMARTPSRCPFPA